MELSKAIKERRSVRKFSDKRVEREDLRKIIEAANYAPSACDIQGWRFIVIDDRRLLQKIIDAGAAAFIKNAPLGVIVVYDNQTDNVEYQDHIQSGAAAIENMILMAHSLNIGSCWVCHLPTKKQLRKILKIPSYYDPIAYIALGYYKEKPRPRARKRKISDLIAVNKFNFEEKKHGIGLGLKARRFGRKIYYKIPFRKYIKPVVDKKFEKKFD